MIYFGKQNNEWVFSPTKIGLTSIVEVSENEHKAFIERANIEQKMISADENGRPTLVDFPDEYKKRDRILELKNYLFSTDWYVIRFMETGIEIPLEIKEKRQLAREELQNG